jgi:5-methylcytosine-specific restriction endonuclease McrA
MQYCPRCKVEDPVCGFAPSDVGKQGKWCRACLRAATHYRMWCKGKVRYPFPIRYAVVCVQCGVYTTSGKPARFCTRACKEDFRKAQIRAGRLASKVERPCPQCGGAIPPKMRSDASYCSNRCRDAAASAARKAAVKNGSDHRARVSRAYIIERDGGRCHICRKKPAPEDIHLDHLVPLSCGGEHTPENLRVACASCNMSRQHRGSAQLLLLG